MATSTSDLLSQEIMSKIVAKDPTSSAADWHRDCMRNNITIDEKALMELLPQKVQQELKDGTSQLTVNELRDIFKEHIVHKIKEPAQADKAIEYLLTHFNQQGLMRNSANAMAQHATDCNIALQRPSIKLEITTNETGFSIKQTATAHHLRKIEDVDYTIEDQGDGFIARAQANLKISFDGSEPKVEIKDSKLEFGSDAIKKVFFDERFNKLMKEEPALIKITNIIKVLEDNAKNKSGIGYGDKAGRIQDAVNNLSEQEMESFSKNLAGEGLTAGQLTVLNAINSPRYFSFTSKDRYKVEQNFLSQMDETYQTESLKEFIRDTKSELVVNLPHEQNDPLLMDLTEVKPVGVVVAVQTAYDAGISNSGGFAFRQELYNVENEITAATPDGEQPDGPTPIGARKL